jgi:hypothetical protein
MEALKARSLPLSYLITSPSAEMLAVVLFTGLVTTTSSWRLEATMSVHLVSYSPGFCSNWFHLKYEKGNLIHERRKEE